MIYSQSGLVPEVWDIAAVQVVLEDSGGAITAATFVPQQNIREDILVTDDDHLLIYNDNEEEEEYDLYSESLANGFDNLEINRIIDIGFEEFVKCGIIKLSQQVLNLPS